MAWSSAAPAATLGSTKNTRGSIFRHFNKELADFVVKVTALTKGDPEGTALVSDIQSKLTAANATTPEVPIQYIGPYLFLYRREIAAEDVDFFLTLEPDDKKKEGPSRLLKKLYQEVDDNTRVDNISLVKRMLSQFLDYQTLLQVEDPVMAKRLNEEYKALKVRV
jgi:hypothetical protein